MASGDVLKKGQRTGTIYVEWGVRQYATALVDARRLVRMAQVALAEQFSADLQEQRRPDTGQVYYQWDGARRILKVGGVEISVDPRFAVESGETAKTWWIGRVSGSIFRGSGKLRPSRKGFIVKRVNELKRKGYVFQSVRGRAAKTIQAAADEYQAIMINPPDTEPTRPDLGETDLGKL